MNDEAISRLDDIYSKYITDECDSDEGAETNHLRADDLLVELLEELGCHKTVEAFNDVEKWYS